MHAPPEFLRSVVDGAFESVLVVLSNGLIWHMNESSRQMFHVNSDGRNNRTAHVSTYLSFCKLDRPNRHSLEISWGDLIAEEPSLNDKWKTSGIGMSIIGDNFPLTINIIRVTKSENKLDRSDEKRRGHQNVNCYYVLYMQDDVGRKSDNGPQNRTENNLTATDSCK